MVRLVSLFVFVLIGTVLCNHAQESEINDPKLGTFEGTFTTANGLLHICLDGRKAQGYYNEVGILQGGTNEDGSKINGDFYFAGHGNCIRGNFELELTSWGLEGFFICSGRPGVVTVQATKLHPFRPTDSQCGLIWEEKTDTLEGRWTDALNNDLYADICFRNPDDDNGDDDDETVQGSLKVVSPTGEVVDTFISGFWGKDGRILSATWYQDLTAGAILMWLRNNGDIDYTWWTGLVYDNGDTFIEYAQATNPLYHGTGTYKPSANRTTTFDECKSNEILQYFVLKNLPRDDDDNYYYFLDTQYIEPENIRYFAQLSTDNSATGISVSLAAIFVGVLALIF